MEKGIFDGLKVLDCASFIAAPAAATVLSDFGADVIKIEPPGLGDPYRNLPNLPGYPASQHNYSWMLEARNKRSLALDLSRPEGQAVLRRLVAEADVFITNFPPAVRERLGLTFAQLAPLNERLIYASFTGYGEKGEEANKPGFDSNAYWARSGLMDLVRADENTTPARSIAGMGDHPCAMAFYGAIVTALYKRERTGKGSHVSSNLMANGIWAASVLAQAKLCGAKFQERRTREHALNAVTNHYKCKDGRWIILSLLNEEQAMAGAGALHRPRGSRHRRAVRHQGRPPCALAGTDQHLRRDLRHQGPRRMAPDPRRQRPGVRRGRHPRRHSQRQADAGERGAGAVRERHHADHQQPDLGRRRQKGAAAQAARDRRAQRRDSCATRAMTRQRSGRCGRPARWRERRCPSIGCIIFRNRATATSWR